jgi:glycosyltransferase involved in cell wall biosynthesis
MRPLRIAEVTATFPPYFGGMGNACLAFSVGLVREGAEVEVYTSRYPDIPYEYPDGLTVHRLRPQFRYGNTPLILGLLRLKSVDVIHLHYPFYFGAEIIYMVSKLRKIPYAVTYQMDMVGTGLLRHMFALHKKLVLKRLMQGAASIYVSSIDYAVHSDLAGIGKIQEKILEVPLGVDIERFTPMAADGRIAERLGIRPADRVIMFVGQLDRPHYFKGVPVLLEAFSRLGRDNVKLVLIGDGDLRPEFPRLTSQKPSAWFCSKLRRAARA